MKGFDRHHPTRRPTTPKIHPVRTMADTHPCLKMRAFIVRREGDGIIFKLEEHSEHLFRLRWVVIKGLTPCDGNVSPDRTGYHLFDCVEHLVEREKLWDFVRAAKEYMEAKT
jgi:hypothetical protein